MIWLDKAYYWIGGLCWGWFLHRHGFSLGTVLILGCAGLGMSWLLCLRRGK